MYTLNNLRAYGTSGSPVRDDDHQTALAHFLALCRPWKVQAGSFIDVENLMQHFRLPTSVAGWSKLGGNERELALDIARYFFHLARMFWRDTDSGAATHVSLLGPTLFSSHLVPLAQLPLSVGITLPAAGTRYIESNGTVNAVNLQISGTHAYSAELNGTYPIASTEWIELGRQRLVIRPEFFAERVSARMPGGRTLVPPVGGMTFTVTTSGAPLVSAAPLPLVAGGQTAHDAFSALPHLRNRGWTMRLLRSIPHFDDFLASVMFGFRNPSFTVYADTALPISDMLSLLTGYLEQIVRGNVVADASGEWMFRNIGSITVVDALRAANLPY